VLKKIVAEGEAEREIFRPNQTAVRRYQTPPTSASGAPA